MVVLACLKGRDFRVSVLRVMQGQSTFAHCCQCSSWIIMSSDQTWPKENTNLCLCLQLYNLIMQICFFLIKRVLHVTGNAFCHIETCMVTIFRLFSIVSQEMQFTFEGNMVIFTLKGKLGST